MEMENLETYCKQAMRKKVNLNCSKIQILTAWEKDGAIYKDREVRAGGSSQEKHNEFSLMHTEFDLAFEIVRLALGKN